MHAHLIHYQIYGKLLLQFSDNYLPLVVIWTSVAEPHHFYAAPGTNFDAAPAPTLLYSKAKFLKWTKV
jgi:hypothetical protein